jgi:hypothetical protein
MTTQQIADRLVILCRQGQFEAAQKELYANDAVSIEPQASPAFAKETKGLEAIFEKDEYGIHDSGIPWANCSDPLINGNRIAIAMTFDVTLKERVIMSLKKLLSTK